MTELILLMEEVLENITTSPNDNQQGQSNQKSPSSSANNWNDTTDTWRKARKSIVTQFTENIFSDKYGDNWDRRQERFLKVFHEWEI